MLLDTALHSQGELSAKDLGEMLKGAIGGQQMTIGPAHGQLVAGLLNALPVHVL